LAYSQVKIQSASTYFGFFYKYTPLPNLTVENDPRRKILPFLAWRERQKATRGSFRHWYWRKEESATGTGGMLNPPLALAETPWPRHRGWREVAQHGGK
jgi:hypothetical protein